VEERDSAHFTQLKLLPAIFSILRSYFFVPRSAAAKRHLRVSVAEQQALSCLLGRMRMRMRMRRCGHVDNVYKFGSFWSTSWQPFYFSFAGNFRYN